MTVVSPVNYLAVLVAGIVYFVLGAVWYARPVFGNAWMRLINRSDEQAKAGYSIWKLAWAFVGSLLAAYAVARILSLGPNYNAFSGLMIGILLGVNISFVSLSVNDSMEGRPFRLTLLNSFYNLVGLVVMGLIIGSWR